MIFGELRNNEREKALSIVVGRSCGEHSHDAQQLIVSNMADPYKLGDLVWWVFFRCYTLIMLMDLLQPAHRAVIRPNCYFCFVFTGRK